MADLLTEDEVTTALATLDSWTWAGGSSGLVRTAKLPTFLTAIAVVDRVAVVAEQMDHHPDIDIRWRTLTFTCATHSKGGVTDLDIRLATQIDEIIAAA